MKQPTKQQIAELKKLLEAQGGNPVELANVLSEAITETVAEFEVSSTSEHFYRLCISHIMSDLTGSLIADMGLDNTLTFLDQLKALAKTVHASSLN